MQRIKRFFLVATTLFSSIILLGQATTNSPYSRYGLGMLRPESFNRNISLGGVGLGLRSLTDLNYMNPASYSAITITSVEFGFTNNALLMTDGQEEQFQNNAYVNHLAFGFPVINKKWGMSFGLKPFSNIGYEYSNTTTNSDTLVGDVFSTYKGDGGFNQAYFGNGVKFNLDSTSFVSVGANFSVLFGSINSDKKVLYSDISNALNIWEIEQSSVIGSSFDFGLQYRKTFINPENEKYHLTLGSTYTLRPELDTETLNLVRTFRGTIDFGQVKDTIVDLTEQKGKMELPSRVGVGLAFEKENKWLMAVDFKSTAWESISNPDTTLFTYKNSFEVAAGFEFIPKHDAFNSYFKRVKYRFGFRYGSANMVVNNQDINNYGITFGLGLPLKRTDTAVPGVNIGVEYGSRGVATSGLIEEKYLNFNLGITINDRWFIKRKYD